VTIHSCNSEDKTSVGVRTCQALEMTREKNSRRRLS
jgi:hypothetical protein